jgi:hypothetical protein
MGDSPEFNMCIRVGVKLFDKKKQSFKMLVPILLYIGASYETRVGMMYTLWQNRQKVHTVHTVGAVRIARAV